LIQLGIVVALGSEARCLTREKIEPGTPARLAASTSIIICGMGCDAAAQATAKLIDAGANALLGLGTAAGLDPKLRAGDLVALTGIRHGEEHHETHAGWLQCMLQRLASQASLQTGLLAHAEAALQTVAAKQALRDETGAVAADMESLGIARQADSAGLPWLALRAIVDGAHSRLPPAALAGIDGQGNLHIARLLGNLLKDPGQAVDLLRLGLAFRAACNALRGATRQAGPDFGACVPTL